MFLRQFKTVKVHRRSNGNFNSFHCSTFVWKEPIHKKDVDIVKIKRSPLNNHFLQSNPSKINERIPRPLKNVLKDRHFFPSNYVKDQVSEEKESTNDGLLRVKGERKTQDSQLVQIDDEHLTNPINLLMKDTETQIDKIAKGIDVNNRALDILDKSNQTNLEVLKDENGIIKLDNEGIPMNLSPGEKEMIREKRRFIRAKRFAAMLMMVIAVAGLALSDYLAKTLPSPNTVNSDGTIKIDSQSLDKALSSNNDNEKQYDTITKEQLNLRESRLNEINKESNNNKSSWFHWFSSSKKNDGEKVNDIKKVLKYKDDN